VKKRIENSDLAGITKDDLIRFILKKELGELISEKKGEKKKHVENIEIPVSIFNTKLSPLESIVRYLKEKQNKKINEIAKLLGKNPSAISLAYKKAISKKFDFKKTDFFIPLRKFEKNRNLSILEIIVKHLKESGQRLTEIAKLLDRSPKTIWTLFNRGTKKQGLKDVKKQEKVSEKGKRIEMKGGQND